MQIWPAGSDQYSASETVKAEQRDGIKYWVILATLSCNLSVQCSIKHPARKNRAFERDESIVNIQHLPLKQHY